MTCYEFSLQLDIPVKYPDCEVTQIRYHCHDSDGLNHCDCVAIRKHRGPERCCFYGRPIEPLAFHLPPYSEVQQQLQSPLYGVLPKEIRQLIFEFAFSDSGALAADRDNVFRRARGTDADVPNPDIARALLQTCKSVYLEAYRLPMQLNGYQSYRNGGRSRPDLERIAPWQYALVQRLDLSLQQVSVEGQDLKHALADWTPMLRHSGAYVVPRFYNGRRPEDRPTGVIQAHHFGLMNPSDNVKSRMNDGDKVTLLQGWNDPSLFTACAMVARTITHLTLRMSRTDWWTWSDDPDTTDDDKQLALDPACGTTTRPSVTDMLELADARRSGQHPAYKSSWGGVVGSLHDLKLLELILETFSCKGHQLDTVVDCARTWKFPLQDTRYELTHDDKVESLKWAKATDGDGGFEDNSEQEREETMLDEDDGSHEQAEGRAQEAISPSRQEYLHDPDAVEELNNQDTALDESWYGDESFEPSPACDRDCQSDFSGTSPVYTRDPYADDWDVLLDEPWMRASCDFEVRIVRFRRRRAN